MTCSKAGAHLIASRVVLQRLAHSALLPPPPAATRTSLPLLYGLALFICASVFAHLRRRRLLPAIRQVRAASATRQRVHPSELRTSGAAASACTQRRCPLLLLSPQSLRCSSLLSVFLQHMCSTFCQHLKVLLFGYVECLFVVGAPVAPRAAFSA